MTTELKAGRELDALVAEKVFGWVWLRRIRHFPPPRGREFSRSLFIPDHQVKPYTTSQGEVENVPAMGDEPIDAMNCPNYSTDIATAWLVVEKLRADGWLVSVKSMPPKASFIIEGSRSEYDAPSPDILIGSGVVCELKWMGEDWRHSEFSKAETAPLSICAAALAALEAV